MNESLKDLLSKFIGNKNHKLILGLFLLIGIVSMFLQKPKMAQDDSHQPTSADTYIPVGMVLIPVEIQNKEALSNMMGDFGIVDLYVPNFGEHIRSKKIATGIKIMRAPLNPEVYAVLVKEEHAGTITEFPGPFIVTIQNPKTHLSKIHTDKKQKRKIEIISEL